MGRAFLWAYIYISCFLLVPALVPGLVSLLVSLLVSSFFAHINRSDFVVFPGSGWGSGACLPSSLFFLFFGKGFCSIMMSWFFWFRLVFRCLFPFSSLFSFLQNGVLFHHDFLVPGGSGSGAGACLPSSFFSQEMVFCFLVPAQVPVLVSLLLSSFFSQERGSVPS